MSTTNIEWASHVWNPIVGCSKISPGCKNCYAEKMAYRLRCMALKDIADGKNPGRKRHYIDAVDEQGRWTGKLIPVPEALADPFGWRKPRRVFVNSMSDLFHESLDDHFIFQVLDICHQTSITLGHTFQILTKRAQRMYEIVCRWIDEDPMPDGIWLGVSVENQEQADARIPWLLKTPAAVRFLSCEPLLGPIDLSGCLTLEPDRDGSPRYNPRHETGPMPDWVIVGGESGPKARRCDVAWIRRIVRQCKAAVPCFVKQLGANAWFWDQLADGLGGVTGGGGDTRYWLSDRKGGMMAEWPEDLRVREFPR